MTRSSQMQIDLSKKLQAKVGELLEREAKIATHVLSTGEVMLTLIEASACMLASCSASVAATHSDDDFGASFDRTINAIVAIVMADRERAMARIAQQRKQPA